MSDRLRYEQDPLMRGSPRISGSRSQSTILTPSLFGDLRPLKISPPKVEKPTSGTELYHRANSYADRPGISVPGQKMHIFPYRGLP